MESAIYRLPAAELRHLAKIRRFVESAATALGGHSDDISELVTAVNEAVANTLMHGYRNQPGPIVIAVSRSGRDLTVCVRDQAPLFDPTTIPAPDVSLPLEQRPIGGMGVHMMRQFTDRLSYSVTADGGNELILVKERQRIG